MIGKRAQAKGGMLKKTVLGSVAKAQQNEIVPRSDAGGTKEKKMSELDSAEMPGRWRQI